ncbi:MAG: hypothetical protein ACRDTG_26925 [Pseudonocardiaceae bacterium]
MRSRSAYYAMIIVDIEQFGRRKNADQHWLRRQMYDVLESAAERAGIPWSQCHLADRGDGVIILIPASEPVSKEEITEGFVRELNTELGTYAGRSREAVAMRMRVALHAGDVVRDDQGWVGAELNTACRLVDLPALRDALRQAPHARLALIVSDMWFKTVVSHDPGAVDHRAYTRVPINIKELDDWAWIHLPGHPTPDVPPPPNTGPTDVPAQDTERIEASAMDGAMTLTFSGPVNVGNDFVGRDQINNYPGVETSRRDPQ